MARKLADLFESSANEIYTRFAPRENPNDQPYVSIVPDSPASRNKISADTQSIPVVSVGRDTTRVSKFLRSSTGVLFLQKQALLQSGNTFENTRIFNPASPLLNVVPFIHVRRHLPVAKVFSVFQDPNLPGVLQQGTIKDISSQFSVQGKLFAIREAGRITFRQGAGLAAAYLGQKLKRALPNLRLLPSAENFYNTRPEYKVYGYNSYGELISPVTQVTNTSTSTGPYVSDRQPLSQRGIPRLNIIANVNANVLRSISSVRLRNAREAVVQGVRNTVSRIFSRRTPSGENTGTPALKFTRDPITRKIISQTEYAARNAAGAYQDNRDITKIDTFVAAAQKFKNNFYTKNTKENSGNFRVIKRFKSPYLTESELGAIEGESNSETENPLKFRTRVLGNAGIGDPFNRIIPSVTQTETQFDEEQSVLRGKVVTKEVSVELPPRDPTGYNIYQYKDRSDTATNILEAVTVTAPQTDNQAKDDIIDFIFSNGNNRVKFRAFISSIKESVKPEFNEQRYVGRIERFVTYSGVKRSVSLSFNIVSFSSEETDIMWKRLNFLTGMTYPTGAINGFMVPPLVGITIGSIYDNQPAYVESLEYDFLDDSITFDIEKQVPTLINVNMSVSLLEKRSKFYDSPFYRITEKLAIPPATSAPATS